MSSGGPLYEVLIIVLCNNMHSISTENRHFKICLVSKMET